MSVQQEIPNLHYELSENLISYHSTIIFCKAMQIQISEKKIDEQHRQKQVALSTAKPIWRFKNCSILYPMITVNHICNIQDSFFINQKSLRDPQHESQSFLQTIFYFKSVSRISVNHHYVTLHLKKREDGFLPKQYFIERFKSFGIKQFYDIAVHLQHIVQHIKEIRSLTTQQVKANFSKENQEKILEQSLEKLDKKKFFSFFYEFTQQGSSLNQIIISKALLSALGYDYEDIVIDFLKYQQAIFQIISAKLYCLVMEKKSKLLDSVFDKMKHTVMSPEQVKQLTMFRFNDDLLPKQSSMDNQYDRRIRSRIKFSKSHPSVTIFQIQKMNKRTKLSQEPIPRQESQKTSRYKKQVKKHEYDCIRNLLKVSDNCLQQNTRKISTYRLIRKQPVRRARKMASSSSQSQYLGQD